MPRTKQFPGLPKVVWIRFPEEVGKELKERATKRWMNLSEYIRELVRKGLEKEKEEEK